MKLVSTLSEDFMPGLNVLAHSLAINGNLTGLEWIFLLEETSWLGRNTFEKVISYGFQPMLIDQKEIGSSIFPTQFPPTRPRLVRNWQRLRAFLLPPEDEYVLIDVDQLCMKDVTELYNMPCISGCIESWQHPDPRRIGMGLVKYAPSDGLWREIEKALATDCPDKGIWPLAEQSIFNEVLARNPGLLNLLPRPWSMPTFLSIRMPEEWRPEEAIFVHWAGDLKPWDWDGKGTFYKTDWPGQTKVSIAPQDEMWRTYARKHGIWSETAS